LGATQFEEIQIMKFAWQNKIADLAVWNSQHVEEVDMDEYSGLLDADKLAVDLDETGGTSVVDLDD
jgi:hypothetical protein